MVHNLDLIVFATIFAEALRRTQWAMLRVENEFFNNFEQYRSILTIPDLTEDIEKIDEDRLTNI